MHPSPNDVLAVFGGDKTAAHSNLELPVRELSDLQIDDASLPQQQQQQQQQRDGASAIEGYVPRQSSAKLTPPPSRQLPPHDCSSQADGARQFLLSELAAAATVDTVSTASHTGHCLNPPPHHAFFM